jgi:hypothetical protein
MAKFTRKAQRPGPESLPQEGLRNRMGGYSSPTNSSRGTPYALAIFVTVGM